MNVNAEIIEILGNATGLPVFQDEYEGNEKSYITFTYEDETPEAFADDMPNADTVYLQIQLITPKHLNYMDYKHQIRDSLESHDYIVTNIRSFLGDTFQGTEKIRQTVFEANISRSR